MSITVDKFIEKYFKTLLFSLGISEDNQPLLIVSATNAVEEKIGLDFATTYKGREGDSEVILAVMLAACDDVAKAILVKFETNLSIDEEDELLGNVRRNLTSRLSPHERQLNS